MFQADSRAIEPGAVNQFDREAAGARVQQYLTFVLGGETFAIGILAIKEILEYTDLTPVPMTPDYMRGVINLRGAVVPVLDLSIRFGRKSGSVTRRTCIVIIEIEAVGARHDIGVLVDSVNAVLDIRIDDIEPPPSIGASIRTDFIEGMSSVNGRFVILLDVNHILAQDELRNLSELGAPVSAEAVG